MLRRRTVAGVGGGGRWQRLVVGGVPPVVGGIPRVTHRVSRRAGSRRAGSRPPVLEPAPSATRRLSARRPGQPGAPAVRHSDRRRGPPRGRSPRRACAGRPACRPAAGHRSGPAYRDVRRAASRRYRLPSRWQASRRRATRRGCRRGGLSPGRRGGPTPALSVRRGGHPRSWLGTDSPARPPRCAQPVIPDRARAPTPRARGWDRRQAGERQAGGGWDRRQAGERQAGGRRGGRRRSVWRARAVGAPGAGGGCPGPRQHGARRGVRRAPLTVRRWALAA